MPLDHFAFYVPQSKFEDIITFLTTSLQHLGFKEHMRPKPTVVGLGDAFAFLWIAAIGPEAGDEKTQASSLQGNHIAFSAES